MPPTPPLPKVEFTHHDTVIFFLALGLLLLVARVLGELCRRFNQPAVLGELLAGVVLGPTLFGAISPEGFAWLFPSGGAFPIALKAVTSVGIVLFLLVAGLEVDLSMVTRQGKACAIISFLGLVIPFAVGFTAGWIAPGFLGAIHTSRFIFPMFLGTALAISALPVIARTLMDLRMYRSDFGMVVIGAAVVDDITGWLLFAILLGLIGQGGHTPFGLPVTILMVIAFAALMLTFGRWAVHRVLPFVQAYAKWPGGVLGFAATMAFLFASFTEWIGVHAIFGAFLFGIALGDSPHLKAKTRSIIEQFIGAIFAPLFFAAVGLRVNFATNFDLLLTITVTGIACLGKLLGCTLGARIAGYPIREALAVGFAMNARGAMEIILALLALQNGLIGERTFVSLVIMALVTSMLAGTAIQKLLGRERTVRFTDFLPAGGLIPRLQSSTREEAIRELGTLAAQFAALKPEEVVAAAWDRELSMSTGIGNGVAVPHARIAGLKAPVVVAGLSSEGVDFDSPDGTRARVIFLILTSREGVRSQVEILADIATTFSRPTAAEEAAVLPDRVQFLAYLNSEIHSQAEAHA